MAGSLDWRLVSASAMGSYIILKETFGFITRRSGKDALDSSAQALMKVAEALSTKANSNSNGKTGDKPVEYWQREFTAMENRINANVDKVLATNVVPLITAQTAILNKVCDVLIEIKTLVGILKDKHRDEG